MTNSGSDFSGLRVDNSGSDFSGVKVGDRLWYLDQPVEVVGITPSRDYPLLIKLVVSGGLISMTHNGASNLGGPQVLFWDKVEIIPPPRPKRKIAQILTRSEVENIEKRQNLNPERVDLPSETMALIVDTLLYYTTPEEVPYPEQERLVKKTIEVRPYRIYGETTIEVSCCNLHSMDIIGTRFPWCGPIQTIEIKVEE